MGSSPPQVNTALLLWVADVSCIYFQLVIDSHRKSFCPMSHAHPHTQSSVNIKENDGSLRIIGFIT